MVPDVMTTDTADRWGTVPGQYDSSLVEELLIMDYEPSAASYTP